MAQPFRILTGFERNILSLWMHGQCFFASCYDAKSAIRTIRRRGSGGDWQTCGLGRSSRSRPTVLGQKMSEADTELLAAVARVVAAFDALGVDYLVGGSVVRSVFGAAANRGCGFGGAAAWPTR